MTPEQKWLATVLWTSILGMAWIAMVFLHEYNGIQINAELQGMAISALTLLLGISTPIGPAVMSFLKKGVNKIAKLFITEE